MQLLRSLSASALCLACLNAPSTFAQAPDQARADERIEPYHKHHDTRNGHDHVYPDRGSVFREVPRGATVVNYAGLSYRFYDGVWLEPRGPAYIVVAPPIGLIVPTLPAFATGVHNGDETDLYANGTYYRPRPDLGGYEVVNDPQDAPASEPPAPIDAPTVNSAPPASVSSAPVAAVALAAATPQPAAIPQLAAGPQPAAAVVPLPAAPPPVVQAALTTSSVALPAAVPSGPPIAAHRVFAYPRNGQSADQQARDQYECYRFAVAQTGFDPMHPSDAVPPSQFAERQADYQRAQAACFDAHGYTTR